MAFPRQEVRLAVGEEGLELGAEGVGGARPRGGILGGGPSDQVDQLLGRGAHRGRRADPGRVDELRHGVAAVPRVPGEQLVEDRAQEVDVGGDPEPGAVPRDHLRRHVGQGAHDAADVPRAREISEVLGVVERHRDSPVDHVDLAEVADHHVVRLQVPVQHSPGVGVVDRVADLHEEPQVTLQVRLGQRLAFGPEVGQDLGPRAPLDALHDHPRRAVFGLHQHVHRDDVRVLEAAGDPGLAQERRAPEGAVDRVAETLHGHLPPERALLAQPHLPHPPLTQQRPEDHLGVREGRDGVRGGRGLGAPTLVPAGFGSQGSVGGHRQGGPVDPQPLPCPLQLRVHPRRSIAHAARIRQPLLAATFGMGEAERER